MATKAKTARKQEKRVQLKTSRETEEASTSGEDEPEWTNEHEAAFLKTLGALKGNREDIYNDDVKFWDPSKLDNDDRKQKSEKKKTVPLYLKDYERKVILEKGGKFEDSESEEDVNKEEEPGYFEQQEEIRKQIKNTIAAVSDDDDGDLLVRRNKTTEQEKAEEDDYYEWLKTKDLELLPINNELSTLKKAWNDPSLAEDEKFLRDYLLNKEYETDDKKESIPAYEDIVSLEQDDAELAEQQDYETKYNFRFEKLDQDFIKHYPRTVSESLRGGNTKRKEKREEYKKRKIEEKEAAKKEIAQKKMSTKKHIEAKLKALREVVGDDIPIRIEDLEDDFDPKTFDSRMKELFDSKYYADDNGQLDDEDMEKPVFSDMEEDEINESDTIYDDKVEVDDHEKRSDDDVAIKKLAPDNNVTGESEFLRKKDSRRKRKRALVDPRRAKKPLFDPNEKTFEEYLNEYYSLNYEDVIGDQITKFKYREVVPNSFGLEVGEILNADDMQLNSWVSIKRVTAYRPNEVEKSDVKNFELRAANSKIKNKIFNNQMKIEPSYVKKDAPAENGGTKKMKNKKEKTAVPSTPDVTEKETPKLGKTPRTRKKKSAGLITPGNENTARLTDQNKNRSIKDFGKSKTVSYKKNMQTNNKIKKKNDVAAPVDDDRLRAYGINPKKFKAKLKYAV